MTPLLRPRLTAVAAPRCLRLFSASRVRRSGQFTMSISPASNKKSVLDELHSRRHALAAHNTAAPPSSPDNAAVVLASPEFAAWLEDDAFMADLLHGTPLVSGAGNSTSAGASTDAPHGVSVLAAVVAALAPPPPLSRPLSGLSVVYGNAERMLPTLWAKSRSASATRASRGSIGSDLDQDAAMTVEVPALDGTPPASSSPPLQVTLPLANTVFQNGRRSTLLASRWSWTDRGTLARVETVPHEHDLVRPSLPVAAPSTSTVSTLLFPIAEPLTIAAGLGNIVRQVFETIDPDGTPKKPIPAARELESAIPVLLAARKRSDPTLQDGTVSVWALVVPPPLVPFYTQLKQQTAPSFDALSSDSSKGLTTATEQRAAAAVAPHFTALVAAGCRLHKILSGGGGWGLKQGLLSLDPQMSHPLQAVSEKGEDTENDDDDAAMQSFIRSFKSEVMDEGATAENKEAADGVAVPGAVVQFFVAPLGAVEAEAGADMDEQPAQSITLGALGTQPSTSPAGPAFFHNHFGAMSEQGIYLASADGSASIRTKLDAPNSRVSVA